MLYDAHGFDKIYLVCGRTDLRLGVNGLAALIQEQYELDPFAQNVLYMFCGVRADRIKCLLWEGDGYVLLYKRLCNGHFRWPRTPSEAMEITQEQFEWLMKGLTIIQTIHKVNPKRVI